jgi:hypothetical protein
MKSRFRTASRQSRKLRVEVFCTAFPEQADRLELLERLARETELPLLSDKSFPRPNVAHEQLADAVTRLTGTLEIGALSGRLTTVHQSGNQPHQVSSSRSAFASFRDRRVETFGEPAVDRREEIAGLDALALPAQQPSKTCHHSELK